MPAIFWASNNPALPFSALAGRILASQSNCRIFMNVHDHCGAGFSSPVSSISILIAPVGSEPCTSFVISRSGVSFTIGWAVVLVGSIIWAALRKPAMGGECDGYCLAAIWPLYAVV
jgi:hypothetical protein